MSTHGQSVSGRFYAYDNLKFLLILFVVIGHFADELTVNLYGQYSGDPTLPVSDLFNRIYIFLYAFHMPLFMFVSGLFHKTADGKDGVRAIRYLILGILLKLLLFSSAAAFRTDFDNDKPLNFSLFGGDGVYWYLVALAAFTAISYAVRNADPRAVMGFSLLLTLYAGYDSSIGDEFTLSRILIFFPFFYAGAIADPERVYSFFKKAYIRIAGVLIIAVWTYLCFSRLELVYPLRKLFTGRNSYYSVSETTGMDIEFWHRLLCTGISALLCIAFLALMINVRIPFVSAAGARTLQIYFWHRTVLYFLMYINYPQKLAHYFPDYFKVYYVLTAAAVTFILALKPFGAPLNAVIRAIGSSSKDKREVR